MFQACSLLSTTSTCLLSSRRTRWPTSCGPTASRPHRSAYPASARPAPSASCPTRSHRGQHPTPTCLRCTWRLGRRKRPPKVLRQQPRGVSTMVVALLGRGAAAQLESGNEQDADSEDVLAGGSALDADAEADTA
jgi:hypothetical protein